MLVSALLKSCATPAARRCAATARASASLESLSSATRPVLPPLSNSEMISHGVLDLVREAIIETGPDFRVTGWNRGAQSIYGWTAEEALGREVRELLRSELED